LKSTSHRRRRAEPSAGARTLLQEGGVRGRYGVLLAEAESAIAANAYDLVLTDLRMARPDDGLKVLRAAVQKNPWTQVIVLTAYATVETAKEAIRYGAYDYLTKPFEQRDPPQAGAGRPRAEGRRRRPPEGAARNRSGDFLLRGDRPVEARRSWVSSS